MRLLASAAALLLAFPVPALGQAGDEARTASYLEAVRAHTPSLYAFLRQMPKGGDLHSHLSGAVYAESFLRWAAEDGSCFSVRAVRIVNAPCEVVGDTIPAARALATAAIHDAYVDSASMRNWHPSRISGHDQFFSTFRRLTALPRRTGDMLAEAMSRAAAGNVSYLELMQTFDDAESRRMGGSIGWLGSFAAMHDSLLAAGIPEAVDRARAQLDATEARRDSVLFCGSAAPDPGCDVTVRWLYQVLRASAPEQVFAQIMMGFLATRADPRVVGLNLVQPEDHPIAMRDYSLHMRMIQWLRERYPDVPVTLHAGELAPGLVPPRGLRFHIREAVEIAGAARIGHGVDVMYEDRPHELLSEMARRGVMVEINLSSNDVILGVSGRDHPLHSYMSAGVPVALSTDDEGVSRSEMTLEYVRAVQDQNVGYPAVKTMARTSLQHAFVEGDPIWRDFDRLQPVSECAPAAGGFEGERCAAWAASSTRGELQRKMEVDLARFEARFAGAVTRPHPTRSYQRH